MGRLALILGGARSGKSSYAERLVADKAKVIYFATAEAGDLEMADRIERHRKNRPTSWKTVVSPTGLAERLRADAMDFEAAIIDCLTLYVSNLMTSGLGEGRIAAEIEELAAACREIAADVAIVSNEVGLGVVPANKLGRAYRDLLGRCNQLIAAAADDVYFMVAGIPVRIKGGELEIESSV